MVFLVIEGGSVLAITGGLLSYIHGDTVVGNGGLLLGIAGIITAAAPILQGWLIALREERKQRLERLEIPGKMRENEAAICVLRDEVTDLHESVRFKRDLIEQQQKVISILVARVGTIEVATANVEKRVSEIQVKSQCNEITQEGCDGR